MRENKIKQNRGFTLVELLVAVAVLSIAMTGVLGLIRMATQYYSNSSREVEVQNQLQLTFTQISNMIIDANVDVIYDDAEERVTIVNSKGFYIVQKSGEKLYVHEGTFSDPNVSDSAKISQAMGMAMVYTDNNVLADRVETFKMDTSAVKQGRVVLALRMTYANSTAYLSQNVFLRNTGDEESNKLSQFPVAATVSGTNVTVSIKNGSGEAIAVGREITFEIAADIQGLSLGYSDGTGGGFTAMSYDPATKILTAKYVVTSEWSSDASIAFSVTGITSASGFTLQKVID